MCYYMLTTTDPTFWDRAKTWRDWIDVPREYRAIPATKVSPPAQAESDYWWRGEFTMLRRNGYNDKLVNRFDRITKCKIE